MPNPQGNHFLPRRGLHTPAQGRAKRRQPRGAALGQQELENEALKGRHSANARSEIRFALSGLPSEAILSTQGGAALCPGLFCSGPFGANCAAARSRRTPSLQFTALPEGATENSPAIHRWVGSVGNAPESRRDD